MEAETGNEEMSNDFAIEDSEQKKKKQEMRRKLYERSLSDLRKVLNSAEGRRFIWEILSEAGVFRGSWSSNPHETSYREGKRDIGLFTLNRLLKVSPEIFNQMQKEAATDKMIQKEEAKTINQGE